MAWGFVTAALSLIAACVTQYYIYKIGPCGKYPSETTYSGCAPINVWIQTIPYLLIAFSEIFASITGLEYAFTKAPMNMRSVVTAVILFMSAISYAIGKAFVSVSADPLLVWNYMIIAILGAIGGAAFWLALRKPEVAEDKSNFIPESSFKGRQMSHGGQAA